MDSNIVKFKPKKQLNIGLIIFGIIFIYLIITIVMYLTASHITVYEVREGSILKDNTYTGLALREEQVVYSDGDGFINYYNQSGSKAKVGSKVYTLSDKALDLDDTSSDEELELSSEETNSIMRKIQQFNNDYEEENFGDVYNVKTEIKNTLGSLSNQSRLDQLNVILSQGNYGNIHIYTTADDGIVVYSTDGMESLTKDTATLEDMDRTNYVKTEYSNNTQINSGDPVYKMITSETWSLMIEIDEETAEILEEKTYVKVNFTKDDQSMWADIEIQTLDDSSIAFLTFHDSMIRYASERYLEVELILEDVTGLKIPKTAETTKDFYVVSKDYITQGGDGSDSGLLIKTKDSSGNDITAFCEVTIYYEDEEVVYLEPSAFEENTVLIKPESSESCTLSEKRSLKGVYCINKGYAVFKQIKILCESDTYYIVEEGNNYGLSNYDHIALDSTNINENDVVF